jgi:hydrogenase 3 maturation protease
MADLAEKLEHASQILFIGVGNVLRKDDGVGVYISRRIVERPHIQVLTVEVSIENYIGKIQSMHPGEIIMIDCMDLGEKAGAFRLMELSQLEDMTFNTHNISLGRWRDFFPFPAWVLGIQPQDLGFGEHLSAPVQDTARMLLKTINP